MSVKPKRIRFDERHLRDVGSAAGTDKTAHHGYERFYPQFLAPLRRLKRLGIVEIGYGEGHSIPFWRQLFPRAQIYCIDRDVSLTGEGYVVFKLDQSDPEALAHAIGLITDPVHLVVDDGSHLPSHQLSTFSILFESLLQPAGVYIVEDIETSYWLSGEIYGYPTRYGIYNRWSAVEVLKLAVDYLNRSFLSPQDKSLVEYCMSIGGLSPTSVELIGSLTFAQNCIIAVKALGQHRRFYDRDYNFADFIARE
jgi:hypothetical protein